MPPGTPLSEYLRARRALVRPEDVGLASGGRRRVAGLRREELAMAAGISPNYYVRLEQGRDRNPSPQVIEALARALQLDDDATAFLHSIARPEPETRERSPQDQVSTEIKWLIGSWRTTPALVYNRHLDILAANPVAVALTPAMCPGANGVRVFFMESTLRQFYDDWEAAARDLIGQLRLLVGRDVDDPAFQELVRDLSETSEDFRRLWPRQDIMATTPKSRIYHHPTVGWLQLFPQVFDIVGADRLTLYTRHAEPGSPSERTLNRLADMTAGRRSEE